MASISALDFTPLQVQGNNRFSRVLRHKSGVELTASTITNANSRVLWYARGDRKKYRENFKICFAIWLALHREGIHLG